jgi:hypothetical protein
MAFLASGVIVNHALWLSKVQDLFGEAGPELEQFFLMLLVLLSSLAIFVVLFVLHLFGFALPIPTAVLGILGAVLGGFEAILLWKRIDVRVPLEIKITEKIARERRIVTGYHAISVLAGCVGVGVLLDVAHAWIVGSDSPSRWYHGVVLIWPCGIFAIAWGKRKFTLIDLIRTEIRKT